MEDEEILLQNHSQWYHRGESSGELRRRLYFPLPTAWIAGIEIFCIFLYGVFVFAPFTMPVHEEFTLTPYQLKAGVGVFLFLLTVGFYRLRNIFHRRARRRGYLKFYRQTRVVSKLPPISWAMQISVIALVSTLWPPGYDDNAFAPVNVLQISTSVIGAVVIAAIIYYIVLVVKHNRRKSLPDSAAFKNPEVDLPEAAMSADQTKRVLDDQAEYIRHLLEQNRSLMKRVRGNSDSDSSGLRDSVRNTLSAAPIGAKERLTYEQSDDSSGQSSLSSSMVDQQSEELQRLKDLLAMERNASSSFQDIIAKQRQEIERLQHLHDSDD